MNLIDKLFLNKKKYILSIYFTAGYPTIKSTKDIIYFLQKYNVDIIEVGIPYSDALADGTTIQNSSNKSLINGMNIDLLFEQLQCLKNELYIPIILMGYYSSFFIFGENLFLSKCMQIGISGLINPDIPISLYRTKYQELFKKYNLYLILLMTTQTPIERIFILHTISKGFLYLVSSLKTTGKQLFFSNIKYDFFTCFKKKILLNIPILIGFGISNKKTFNWSCSQSKGAIIGSSFIKYIDEYDIEDSIKSYLEFLKK